MPPNVCTMVEAPKIHSLSPTHYNKNDFLFCLQAYAVIRERKIGLAAGADGGFRALAHSRHAATELQRGLCAGFLRRGVFSWPPGLVASFGNIPSHRDRLQG